MHPGAIGALTDDLDISDWPILPQGYRQWGVFVCHWRTVQMEERPSPAPLRVAEPGAAPPDVDGSPIEESDTSPGIGRVDGPRQRFEQLAKSLLAFAQALVRNPALGDVSGYATQPHWPPFGIAHDGTFNSNPAHLSSLRVVRRIHHPVLGLADAAVSMCSGKSLVYVQQVIRHR